MKNRQRKSVHHLPIAAKITLVVLLGNLAFTSTADAGLLDWLFPLRRARQAARQAQGPLLGQPLLGQVNNAYTTAYRGYNNYGPAFAGYRPYTAYRTVWRPVPVTNYQPNSAPCTSYTWQARRVPYAACLPTQVAATPVACNHCNSCSGAAASYATPIQYQYAPAQYAPAQYAANQYAPARSGPTVANQATFAAQPASTPPTLNYSANYASTYGADDGWVTVRSAQANRQPDANCNCQASPADYQAPLSTSAGDPPGATPWRPVESVQAAGSSTNGSYRSEGAHSRSGSRTRLEPVPADTYPQLDRQPRSTRYAPSDRGYYAERRGQLDADYPRYAPDPDEVDEWDRRRNRDRSLRSDERRPTYNESYSEQYARQNADADRSRYQGDRRDDAQATPWRTTRPVIDRLPSRSEPEYSRESNESRTQDGNQYSSYRRGRYDPYHDDWRYPKQQPTDRAADLLPYPGDSRDARGDAGRDWRHDWQQRYRNESFRNESYRNQNENWREGNRPSDRANAASKEVQPIPDDRRDEARWAPIQLIGTTEEGSDVRSARWEEAAAPAANSRSEARLPKKPADEGWHSTPRRKPLGS